MTGPHAVEAVDLHCALGKHEILRGIGFHVDFGEILGIVGPNGAGKSTLLKCLGGLLPFRGSVLLQGKPLATLGVRELARATALMHQNTALAYPFPASEVVMMGRYPHQGRFRSESSEDTRIVDQAMRFTDTRRIAGKTMDTLSGGERQRVLLAKTLAQDTGVVLLDEPSASLDFSYQDQIFLYARELARQGKAVVAAIHDLRLAARFCTRILLLSQGKVVAEGPPSAVLTTTHLGAAYGVQVRVYPNAITGELDYHLEADAPEQRCHVHVIGGGGSAAEVLRLLSQQNYRVTTGVLSPGDTDLQVAGAFGVAAVVCDPFSGISDEAFEENRLLALEADLTIVCNLAVGRLNLRNLEAAFRARHLVILEDEDFRDRDFTGGLGAEVYGALRALATVLKTDELADWLTRSRD